MGHDKKCPTSIISNLEAECNKMSFLLKSIGYTCDSWIDERINDYEFMMSIKELLAGREKV